MKLIDIKQLSSMTGFKVKTIYDWVHKERVPHYKIGKLLRFDLDEIERWLKSKKRKVNRNIWGFYTCESQIDSIRNAIIISQNARTKGE